MLEAVRNSNGGFDVDAWHVMDQRDDALIAQEVLHGTGSSKFVYQFAISGTTVTGISVIGARHLAAHYGGIKHRLLASVSKIGALFTFTSYPQPGMPMTVDAQVIEALAHEDDYYEVLIEVSDIKTGNTIQMRKRESAQERKRDGSKFDRPHYSVIAEAKAYRNAVLALIDQGVQLKWKTSMLALGKDESISDSVIEEKRALVLRFAASKGIGIDRRLVEALTLDQIAGLGDAARAGGAAEFRAAAEALRVTTASEIVEQQAPQQAAAGGKPAARIASDAGGAPVQQQPAQQAQPAPQPAQPVQQQAPQQSPPLPPPLQMQQQPAKPDYQAYLVDEHGEMADGAPVFRDPAAFLIAVVAMAAKVGDLDTFLDNNEDEIVAARDLAPQTALDFDAEIDALRARKAPPAADSPVPLAVPTKGGKPDLSGYLAAARAQIDALPDADALTAWNRLNEAVIAALPSVTRKAAQKALADRADALGASKAPPVDPPPPAAETAPADDPVIDVPEDAGEHADRYRAVMTRVLKCRDNASLTALGDNTDFNADLDALPRELRARVRGTATALRQQFAAQQ